jgi:hypothetical protein
MSTRTELDTLQALGGGGSSVQVASANSVATTAVDIVPAPGAGLRIRLFSVLISGEGPASSGGVITLSDSSNDLGEAVVGQEDGANFTINFGSRGILLPENKELERTTVGTMVALIVTAVYKIESI